MRKGYSLKKREKEIIKKNINNKVFTGYVIFKCINLFYVYRYTFQKKFVKISQKSYPHPGYTHTLPLAWGKVTTSFLAGHSKDQPPSRHYPGAEN